MHILPRRGALHAARGGDTGLKSYLLSWLRKTHAAASLEDFQRERAGDWIVWEAGPWRPPAARRDTLVAGPNTRLLEAGESLAIELAPRRPGPEVKLGRESDNDLVIDDATLSRVHLVLRREADGRWTVRDAGSRNGTRVDGVPIRGEPVAISPGSLIEAGAVRLTLHDPASLWARIRAGT